MCSEISAERDEAIYICACLLLDPLQLYIEMSVVFGLSVYTATANSCTFGNENMWLIFVW
jgi:hypothetical protein